jgi:hypothetical protein
MNNILLIVDLFNFYKMLQMDLMMKRYLFALMFGIISFTALAEQPIHLKSGAPLTYTVQPGDSLIDIADKYLDNPMQWRQLLQINPQIKHPYRLYPGQVLNLGMVDGQPVVRISSGGTVKISPKIRSTEITNPIPIIPLQAIQPFLNRSRVVSQNELRYAPYIVAAADEHLVTGAGDRVYALGVGDCDLNTAFSIYRPGKKYKDPRTLQLLGYEALFIADAQIVRTGSPATLLITESDKEVQPTDKLMPVSSSQIATDFELTRPTQNIDGDIISVIDAVNQISQYQVVVIDRGKNNGLIPGNVLSIYQRGALIENPEQPLTGYHPKIQLPNEWSGDLMIFRVFENVSYGVVLHAIRAIYVNDYVGNPLVI